MIRRIIKKGVKHLDYLRMQIQTHAPRTPLPVDMLVPGRGEKGPFKLAILLHDVAGNNTSWMRRYTVESVFEGSGTVVVMPSCLNSFYVNMYYGYDMLDYIVKEIAALCKGWFNMSDKPEDRLVAGYGMGGYGAVRAALEQPVAFGKAISINGLLEPDRFYDDPIPALKMKDVFGPKEFMLRSANHLPNAVRQLTLLGRKGLLPEITLCGGSEEDQRLYEALQKAGIPADLTTEDPMTVLAGKVRE